MCSGDILLKNLKMFTHIHCATLSLVDSDKSTVLITLIMVVLETPFFIKAWTTGLFSTNLLKIYRKPYHLKTVVTWNWGKTSEIFFYDGCSTFIPFLFIL